jgi:transposase-like protein|tara:strand:- start:3324 stop:4601 length:1278 start_codon:yes stop_codon:yes gene_type:complete
MEDMLMKESTQEITFRTEVEDSWSVLEQIARNGARQMLQQALENEACDYLEAHRETRDENGCRMAVRNGYMPERELVSGLGPVSIRQPRIDDRKLREKRDTEQFSSSILPRYLRRMPSVDNLIPVLYLKGISTGDFQSALASILGEGVVGLSATNITKLKSCWEDEYQHWSKRELRNKKYVYWWADGIHFNVRLDDERSCILLLMGADEEGNKELIAVQDGYRESKQSWRELLMDLKARGLTDPAKLAVGDGALGFWAALGEIFPETRPQRCWVHKTANILDKMPKSVRGRAKEKIHDMYLAENKELAVEAYKHFISVYKDKYPKAVECLEHDNEDLFTFYDFPAVHWIHIRTTNPIESTFATVRHRTRRTKGCGSRIATLTMVFKLVQEAQKTWLKLRGYKTILFVMAGRKFVDGEMQEEKVSA